MTKLAPTTQRDQRACDIVCHDVVGRLVCSASLARFGRPPGESPQPWCWSRHSEGPTGGGRRDEGSPRTPQQSPSKPSAAEGPVDHRHVYLAHRVRVRPRDHRGSRAGGEPPGDRVGRGRHRRARRGLPDPRRRVGRDHQLALYSPRDIGLRGANEGADPDPCSQTPDPAAVLLDALGVDTSEVRRRLDAVTPTAESPRTFTTSGGGTDRTGRS